MDFTRRVGSGKAENVTILNKLKDFRVDDKAARELRGQAPPSLSRGEDALALLARSVEIDEASASSHWRAMHDTFRLAEGTVSGARGFGTYSPGSHRIEAFAHRILQRPWRALGAAYADFDRIDRLADALAARQGRIYDLDMLRQALTLAYLEAQVPATLNGGKTLLVIGDGYGTFAALALAAFPRLKVVTINLVKSLIVDLHFISRGVPGADVGLATGREGLHAALADDGLRVIALRADDCALLSEVPASLAVNIASMQEMDPPTIARYFQTMRSMAAPVTFYCCNRERKSLPDGTMVAFAEYPWQDEDRVLDDGLCPWHQRYYSARPPFVHRFDGPIRHRLAVLAQG